MPRHVLRRLAAGEAPRAPYGGRFAGTVLLADIRGFTRLTEQMAARGPEGVELFTDAMNRYFGGMIDCVGEHGGEVVSFAGDALLAIWPAGESTPAAALEAAAGCALVLATRDAAVAPGVDARLRVRLAVAAGELAGLEVGRPTHQIYCCLMGARWSGRRGDRPTPGGARSAPTRPAGNCCASTRPGRPAPAARTSSPASCATGAFPPAGGGGLGPAEAALAPYIPPSVLAQRPPRTARGSPSCAG